VRGIVSACRRSGVWANQAKPGLNRYFGLNSDRVRITGTLLIEVGSKSQRPARIQTYCFFA
jgi:hypothetical protein